MDNTTTEPETRYSVPDSSAVQHFSWEYPVPVNDFWNPLDFVIGRNFLKCFSPEELEGMRLEEKGALDQAGKIKLLLDILQEKLKKEESKVAPRTLCDVHHDYWDDLLLAETTMYEKLGHKPNEERVIRELIDKRKDKSNLSHLHSLAYLLEETGRYEEAVEMETPVLKWLDGRLGEESPQSLGSRRIIARALWKQGKQAETRSLIRETFELIEKSGDGKYKVYQEEQREMTETMVEELENGETTV